ncbi:hypothetical protein BJY52DRAFT_1155390 [Lactarius psammicola]|nr:hypothetical protein BJY52DRAFT_1155390 [Lactarius psammicola]
MRCRQIVHLLHALGATYYNVPGTSACDILAPFLGVQFILRVKTKRPTIKVSASF